MQFILRWTAAEIAALREKPEPTSPGLDMRLVDEGDFVLTINMEAAHLLADAVLSTAIAASAPKEDKPS
ncbi:MAG: hypothetical protein KGL39_29605 [Patescibacteria group bacterium]|nr:hypothetical protein [Patescibacteria group bacterium]